MKIAKVAALFILIAPACHAGDGYNNPLDTLNSNMFRANEFLANVNQYNDQMDRLKAHSNGSQPVQYVASNAALPIPAPRSMINNGEVHLQAGSPSGNLNNLATFLAEQLTHNRDLTNIAESRIAVTSFVNLENFREANKIGLTLSEHLIHKLQISGYKVVDYKAMGAIVVQPTGDFVLSRNPSELKNEYNIHYFLTGTLSKTLDGIVVNARLLDARTSLVASSAQAFIPARDARKLMSEYSDGEQERVIIGQLPMPQPNMVKVR